jgi:7-cyano-7-deazaguanine synthase
MDSAVVLAFARRAGFACHALSFDYGQRHRSELRAAARVARALGVVRHVILKIDLRVIGGSALTDEIAVPKNRLPASASASAGGGAAARRSSGAKAVRRVEEAEEIPVTYVPARNTIFLSCALGLAETTGARDLFIGVNAIDYSGYPDCRPEFIEAFERVANLATKAGVDDFRRRRQRFRIHAPLASMSKADIVQTGMAMGVDFTLTQSCYDPGRGGRPCGQCDACILRERGFEAAARRTGRCAASGAGSRTRKDGRNGPRGDGSTAPEVGVGRS